MAHNSAGGRRSVEGGVKRGVLLWRLRLGRELSPFISKAGGEGESLVELHKPSGLVSRAKPEDGHGA